MPTTKATYGEKKTMLKGKQKKLPDALKKRIVASMMKKKKQEHYGEVGEATVGVCQVTHQ